MRPSAILNIIVTFAPSIQACLKRAASTFAMTRTDKKKQEHRSTQRKYHHKSSEKIKPEQPLSFALQTFWRPLAWLWAHSKGTSRSYCCRFLSTKGPPSSRDNCISFSVAISKWLNSAPCLRGVYEPSPLPQEETMPAMHVIPVCTSLTPVVFGLRTRPCVCMGKRLENSCSFLINLYLFSRP